MGEYGYLIRTLSNQLHIDFLNYLYAKKEVIVSIDNTVYNIYIRIKNENDFNEIIETTKRYYGVNYAAIKPEPPIQPVFVSNVSAINVTPTTEVTPITEVTQTTEVTPNTEVTQTTEVTPTTDVTPN